MLFVQFARPAIMLEYSEGPSRLPYIIYCFSHPDDEYLSEPEALTNGFCFINNVAVAAAYLKHMYRDQIK
jgi:hypothetical protein